jgi:hypothetical protein
LFFFLSGLFFMSGTKMNRRLPSLAINNPFPLFLFQTNKMDTLAIRNAHPRDSAISFNEAEHKYTVAGDDRPYTSVTTFIGNELFAKFDALAVATKLVDNHKMSDPDYKYYGMTVQDIVSSWNANGKDASELGTAMHLDIERFFNGVPVENTSVEYSYFLDFWRDYGCKHDWLQSSQELSNEEPLKIKQKKSPKSKKTKATKATKATKETKAPDIIPEDSIEQLEDDFLRMNVELTPGVPLYPTEHDRSPNDLNCVPLDVNHGIPLVPYRTEWCVYYEEYQISGSIDMVFENPDGTIQIYDWKRCKEISPTHSNPDYPKYGKAQCVRDLPDTHYWHYALQLNLYKRILETKYGKKVVGLYLICLHPIHREYQRIRLPFIPKHIDSVLKYRKQLISPKLPTKIAVKPLVIEPAPECLI